MPTENFGGIKERPTADGIEEKVQLYLESGNPTTAISDFGNIARGKTTLKDYGISSEAFDGWTNEDFASLHQKLVSCALKELDDFRAKYQRKK